MRPDGVIAVIEEEDGPGPKQGGEDRSRQDQGPTADRQRRGNRKMHTGGPGPSLGPDRRSCREVPDHFDDQSARVARKIEESLIAEVPGR